MDTISVLSKVKIFRRANKAHGMTIGNKKNETLPTEGVPAIGAITRGSNKSHRLRLIKTGFLHLKSAKKNKTQRNMNVWIKSMI